MNNFIQTLIDAPLIVSFLLKITIVLCVGWIVHFLFARSNPRWRVLLWRCVIVGIFLIPALIPLKYLQIRVPKPSSEPPEISLRTSPLESELPFVLSEMPTESIIDLELVE